MRDLSIFIDESGDAGRISKYYIVVLVFHDQSFELDQSIAGYNRMLWELGQDKIPFHFGPLLNGNDSYKWKNVASRLKLLVTFAMMFNKLPISYACFSYEKRGVASTPRGLAKHIERDVMEYFRSHLAYLQGFDEIKIYYDGGQSIVTQAMHSAIERTIGRKATIFKDASPRNYLLSQVADYICGIELTGIKFDRGEQTKTDLEFFGSGRAFKKNYLRKVRRKMLQ